MGPRALRRRRAAAQLLHPRTARPAADVVRALLAVQAQDLRAARLALRARSAHLSAAAVDAALTSERSLVVAWLARGTLHLVAAEDHGWLLGLTAPAQEAGARRRLTQLGVTLDQAERAVRVIEGALAAAGPQTRAELAGALENAGLPTQGQILPHLLAAAARRGLTVLGPVRDDGTQAFALTRDWLGAAARLPLAGERRHTALAELARRWLAAHGPATAADLAAWSGLPLRDARAGLAAIDARGVAGELVDLRDRPPAPRHIAPRLLGAFDPYLLGWKDRSFAVAPEHAASVHPGGGVLRAVATDDGVVVGTWTLRRRPGGAAVRLEPFAAPPPPALARALDADAADVARFEGGAQRSG